MAQNDMPTICHRMSGVIRKEHGGRLVEIECREGRCALWDSLLECCGDLSHVLHERTNIRAIVSDMIANMAEEMTRQVDERDRLMAASSMGAEYGQCIGRLEVLEKTIQGLRRRFAI